MVRHRATYNIGGTVAERRSQLGLSQRQLAQQAGIHLNTVAALEAGGNVTLNNLVAVLQPLGLHILLTATPSEVAR